MKYVPIISSVICMYYLVKSKSLAPPKLKIERDDNIVTFIYLSNLVRTKGADILVRAASLLPPELQDKFKVKMVGKPSDKKYTDEIAELLANNPYTNIELQKYASKRPQLNTNLIPRR